MAHEQDSVDGVSVLRPLGRLDSAVAPEFEKAVQALLADAATTRLVIDLGKVPYIASAGLRVVLLAGKQLRARQGKLALAGVQGLVREVFEMSGFLDLFPVADDVAGAVAKLA